MEPNVNYASSLVSSMDAEWVCGVSLSGFWSFVSSSPFLSALSAVISSITPLLQTALFVPLNKPITFHPFHGAFSLFLAFECSFSHWLLSSLNKRAVGAYRQEGPAACCSRPMSPLLAESSGVTAH